ncbi:type VI secretion system-associated protein [Serratia rubidaea]|uniref:Type VI secretion system-associated protein n=1 Tax=Serratia rubidaea TaxID=61652 RepID=A0A448SM06_SERRU|nr:type VI secretion system-associated protein [Serratia rubidaea]MBH1928748.1 type VI secretion system-associated protein [Serratia rubidaea]MDC6118523.1 type VI secretion system-associated protein [Serratia rubidaea]MEB7587288.1 type VI secretion system-associated protein [Serratia rubidaea]VEI68701.1 Uncharacterised protein [Serratia rubidaea]
MKYWMPGVIALMAVPAVHAANYRLVYSPSQKLEVFIDNVKNNKPESWCAPSIPLRIVSANAKDATVLDGFLPRVGSLLAKQCPAVSQLPWTLTDKAGNQLAAGDALKNQRWKPQVKTAPAPQTQPEAAPQAQQEAPMPPAAVAVSSPQADATPAQVFELPKGCKFRTYWQGSDAGSAMFIPSGGDLTCQSDGWLSGSDNVQLQSNGKSSSPAISFLQGYPLMNIDVAGKTLTVVSANRQRMVLANPQVAGSYLVLPFDSAQHAWFFSGTLIAELPRQQAADAERVKQRVAKVRETWQPLLKAYREPLSVRLVDQLAADRVDPASGSYLTVQNAAH